MGWASIRPTVVSQHFYWSCPLLVYICGSQCASMVDNSNKNVYQQQHSLSITACIAICYCIYAVCYYILIYAIIVFHFIPECLNIIHIHSYIIATCTCYLELRNCICYIIQAIFKNYDLDKDGYISVEEFETISSNFPFIESSFCVLDVSE